MSRPKNRPRYVVTWHDHPHDGWVLHHVSGSGRLDPNPVEGVGHSLAELLESLDAMREAVLSAQRREV